MKHLAPIVACILIPLLCIPSVSFAQSKKKLRQELARLEASLGKLKLENQQILNEKADLEQKYQTTRELSTFLREEVDRLREEIDATNSRYQALSEKFDRFQERHADQLPSTSPTPSSTDELPATEELASATPSPPVVKVAYAEQGSARAKDLGCASLADRLDLNQSYSLSYESGASGNWGMQVYAFSTLCQAEQEAKAFSQQHTRFPTFVRPKLVNNRKLFAVVYGSWNQQSEAAAYCEQYRAQARSAQARGAFVLKH